MNKKEPTAKNENKDKNLEQLTDLLIEFLENMLSWEQEVIKKTGLSPTQVHIVEYLGRHEPPQMKNIARFLGITTGSLTIAIDNLEKHGYTQRQNVPNDRRAYRVELTEAGKALYAQHRSLHLDLTANGVADFSVAEVKLFCAHLQRFTSRI